MHYTHSSTSPNTHWSVFSPVNNSVFFPDFSKYFHNGCCCSFQSPLVRFLRARQRPPAALAPRASRRMSAFQLQYQRTSSGLGCRPCLAPRPRRVRVPPTKPRRKPRWTPAGHGGHVFVCVRPPLSQLTGHWRKGSALHAICQDLSRMVVPGFLALCSSRALTWAIRGPREVIGRRWPVIVPLGNTEGRMQAFLS